MKSDSILASNGVDQLTHSRVTEIMAQRREMLSSIRREISTPLYTTLEKKLEYEQVSLCAIIESDAKADAATKELNLILKAEYFIQKPLEIDII